MPNFYTFEKDPQGDIVCVLLDAKRDLHFIKHTDAGHGWLEVPFRELLKSGVGEKISHYSYFSLAAETVFLEEDCDMSLFLHALEASGREYSIETCELPGLHWIRNEESFDFLNTLRDLVEDAYFDSVFEPEIQEKRKWIKALTPQGMVYEYFDGATVSEACKQIPNFLEIAIVEGYGVRFHAKRCREDVTFWRVFDTEAQALQYAVALGDET